MMKQVFRDVYVVKPESSRAMSAEAFVIGVGFMANGSMTVLSESIAVLQDKSPTLGTGQQAVIQEAEKCKEETNDDDKLTF